MTEIDERIRNLCDKIKKADVRSLEYDELVFIENQLEIADLIIILLRESSNNLTPNEVEDRITEIGEIILLSAKKFVATLLQQIVQQFDSK